MYIVIYDDYYWEVSEEFETLALAQAEAVKILKKGHSKNLIVASVIARMTANPTNAGDS